MFTLVPGSTITGPAPESSDDVTIPLKLGETTVSYQQNVETNHGVYVLTVPYPGNYTIDGETVHVTEDDVERGVRYETFNGPGTAYWSFDEGEGKTAYERWNGHHMHLRGGTWTNDGYNFSDRNAVGRAVFENQLIIESDESMTIQIEFLGNLSASGSTYPTVLYSGSSEGEIGIWANNNLGRFGVRLRDKEGDTVRLFALTTADFGSKTVIRVILDRESNRLELYRNGSLVGYQDTSNIDSVYLGSAVYVGSRNNGKMPAPIIVSDLKVYHSVQSPRISDNSTS